MIKKLLLTLSFIALATITFTGTTYTAQAGETIVITEELSNLNKLYIEGIITEEEFSKAKSILLNPDSGTTKKKKKGVIFKKQKLTAAERRQLENELIEAEKALKEQLRAEKRAERERIKQASLDEKKERELEKQASLEEQERIKAERAARKAEKKRLKAEWKKACSDDPESKACLEGTPSGKVKKSLLKIKKKLGG